MQVKIMRLQVKKMQMPRRDPFGISLRNRDAPQESSQGVLWTFGISLRNGDAPKGSLGGCLWHSHHTNPKNHPKGPKESF